MFCPAHNYSMQERKRGSNTFWDSWCKRGSIWWCFHVITLGCTIGSTLFFDNFNFATFFRLFQELEVIAAIWWCFRVTTQAPPSMGLTWAVKRFLPENHTSTRSNTGTYQKASEKWDGVSMFPLLAWTQKDAYFAILWTVLDWEQERMKKAQKKSDVPTFGCQHSTPPISLNDSLNHV